MYFFTCVRVAFLSTIHIYNRESNTLQDRVEPPILLSRLMAFVFAAMLVVLVAMLFALYNMFPTNRPQVLFLMTAPKEDLPEVLREMVPVDENMGNFKRSFIREYIRARNEIVPDVAEMRKKWNNDENGVIHAWSTQDVYNAFTQTNMWNAWMSGVPDFEFSCSVEFDNGAIEPVDLAGTEYTISFRYFCSDSNRQMDKKEYKIRIKLDIDDNATIRWDERLNNPLGIRVSEYIIESDNGDPLDTGYLASVNEQM